MLLFLQILMLATSSIVSATSWPAQTNHVPAFVHQRHHQRLAADIDSLRRPPQLVAKNNDVSSIPLFNVKSSDRSMSPSSDAKQGPGIIFPGGGLFFYWQAGVVAHLQEQGYDLHHTLLAGASAGALSATLAKTEVSPYDATELALAMSEEMGIWERPLGLQGVWGGIIYDWLDQLLPPDADEMVKEELHILLTPIPSFGSSRISQFENREDLINANMASVHIPWFLDGNLTSNFRGKPHIDGSFLTERSEYFSEEFSDRPKLVLDFKRDPVMKDRASEFIKVISKQAIWDILEQGKKHAKIMEQKGEFDLLPRH